MARPDELDSFVRKFRNLWKAGSHAKLYVETEAGNAFVNLQVGLGQTHPQYQDGHRAVGPLKQRRRERRAAAREATAAAEEAGVTAEKESTEEVIENAEQVSEEDSHKPEESFDYNFSDAKLENVSNRENHVMKEHKVTHSPIPQLDGTGDVDVSYDLKIEASD